MQNVKEGLFKPLRSKQESKADLTTRTARAMFDAESAARDAKTARLRQARMEKEARELAEQPAPAAKPKRGGKSAKA